MYNTWRPNNENATSNKNEDMIPVVQRPESEQSEGCKIVNLLSISFAILGILCILVGTYLAGKSYRFDWLIFVGGVISGMFNFGWAVVMRVCALYMRTHEPIIHK